MKKLILLMGLAALTNFSNLHAGDGRPPLPSADVSELTRQAMAICAEKGIILGNTSCDGMYTSQELATVKLARRAIYTMRTGDEHAKVLEDPTASREAKDIARTELFRLSELLKINALLMKK